MPHRRKSLKDEILETAIKNSLQAYESHRETENNHYEIAFRGYFRPPHEKKEERLTQERLVNVLGQNPGIGQPYMHLSDALRYGRDKDGRPHHWGGDHIVEKVDVWIDCRRR